MITVCPSCGRANTEQSNTGSGRPAPRPGDVSICFGCGEPAIYTETSVRKPTPAETTRILANPQVHLIRAGIKIAKGGGR